MRVNKIHIGNEDERYVEKRLKEENVDKDKDEEKYNNLMEAIKKDIEEQDREFIKNLIHFKEVIMHKNLTVSLIE